MTASESTTSRPVKPIDLEYDMLKSSHCLLPQLRLTQATTSCISKSNSVATLRPTDEYVDRQNAESSKGSFLCPMKSVVNE